MRSVWIKPVEDTSDSGAMGKWWFNQSGCAERELAGGGSVFTPSVPRHSMQRKLIVWTVVMVAVSTFVCAWWLTKIAREAMSQSHARGVSLLNQTVAAAMAGRLAGGWGNDAKEVLDGLWLDSRLAFVIVTDAQDQLLHRKLIDHRAWTTYTAWVDEAGNPAAIGVGRAVVLGEEGDLIVHKVPVWNPPVMASGSRISVRGRRRDLEGFVVLALREPGLPQVLAKLRAMQFVTVFIVCILSLPVVVWVVRRWTAPMRSLLEATIRLGVGDQPLPIKVETNDEMGMLSRSFNWMARTLSSTRSELERANEQLERKVKDRTAAFERANQKLESEIRDKNEFLRAVTHDLNAPLRNIGGMAAMLLKKHQKQLSDDGVAKLERIRANVDALTGLIDDLLELSRLRTRPGKRQVVDLNQIVEEVRGCLGYDLEQQDIVLRVQNPLPVIMADRNRIRQIFQNLLDNAVKYMMKPARGEITIDCHREGKWLHFRVADTGRGIASQDLPAIFQVFRRAPHSGNHQVAGRGVGLATVKSIVESYGGRIWVESELGRGSVFHFTLDRYAVEIRRPAVTTGRLRGQQHKAA